jgi:hypothetical protein
MIINNCCSAGSRQDKRTTGERMSHSGRYNWRILTVRTRGEIGIFLSAQTESVNF